MLSNIINNAKLPLRPKPEIKQGLFYDIIGDVHGNADELTALLQQMGYKENTGVWKHEQRKAVFVGDFTSRGPETRRCINIVRNMVEYNTGYAILGNHELNVIGHFTKDKSGVPFKTATGTNKRIMDTIKSEYTYEKKQLKKDIKWLRTLPFFIDLKHIRIVHAYWNTNNLELIANSITKGKLTKSLLSQVFSPRTSLGKAVQQTTRGIELNLPPDLIIKDTKNVRRTNFRILWWDNPKGKSFRKISYGNKFVLPDYTAPPEILFPFEVYSSQSPPVFFGHYCISQEQMIPAPNVCCVDNCIANGGKLAAYRWNGVNSLDTANFIFQKRRG